MRFQVARGRRKSYERSRGLLNMQRHGAAGSPRYWGYCAGTSSA